MRFPLSPLSRAGRSEKGDAVYPLVTRLSDWIQDDPSTVAAVEAASPGCTAPSMSWASSYQTVSWRCPGVATPKRRR